MSEVTGAGQVCGPGGVLSRVFLIAPDYQFNAVWSLSVERVKKMPGSLAYHRDWVLTESGIVYVPRHYGQGPSFPWPDLREKMIPMINELKAHSQVFAEGFAKYFSSK